MKNMLFGLTLTMLFFHFGTTKAIAETDTYICTFASIERSFWGNTKFINTYRVSKWPSEIPSDKRIVDFLSQIEEKWNYKVKISSKTKGKVSYKGSKKNTKVKISKEKAYSELGRTFISKWKKSRGQFIFLAEKNILKIENIYTENGRIKYSFRNLVCQKIEGPLKSKQP